MERARDLNPTPRPLKSVGIRENYAEKYGFSDPEEYFQKGAKGVDHEVVEMISRMKDEPEWMRKFRHDSLDVFFAKPMPPVASMPSLTVSMRAPEATVLRAIVRPECSLLGAYFRLLDDRSIASTMSAPVVWAFTISPTSCST